MNKKIIASAVIKTILFCLSLFILVGTFAVYYVKQNFKPAKEILFQVVVATKDIPANTLVTTDMVTLQTIPNGIRKYDVLQLKDVIGKKTKTEIKIDDAIASYDLINPKSYLEGERLIAIPMDAEQRIANTIQKGSYVDLRVRQPGVIAKTVLSKVVIQDVVDETGTSISGVKLDSNTQNKKMYIELILDKGQRDRLYVAQEFGKLFLELYRNPVQSPLVEDFTIPQDFFTNPGVFKINRN